MGYKIGIKRVTEMEWFGLQNLTAGWTVKNPKNRHPQKVLMPTDRILDMCEKISKMENVCLYTITEFTHLFVDRKHMRPVTEFPVADLTF